MNFLNNQNSKDEMLNAALSYAEMGFSIIPVGIDKKPLLNWKKYQAEKASAATIKEWFAQFTFLNIAIVTGSISGVAVVDVEKGGSVDGLPPTVISKTGGGGWHYYYKFPKGGIGNTTRFREKMDIRGEGGFVVAPPSFHKSGMRYEWAVSPKDADFAEIPDWILKKTAVKERMDWKKFIDKEISEGSRNITATQLAGKIFHELSPELWELAGWATLKDWNKEKNNPPLPEKELRCVWESIKKAETSKKEKDPAEKKNLTQADLLLKIIEDGTDPITLFHNDHKETFARLLIDKHFEIWPLKSRQFKIWLANKFWMNYKKAPNAETLRAALNIIESKALFEGREHALRNRVAAQDNSIWYDLTNKNWQVVEINTAGWKTIDKPPIIFRRYTHQKNQLLPIQGGDAKTFLEFINISDPEQRLLLLVFVISCFIPDFAHVVPIIYGPQGSAKSMLSKLLRKVIDPSLIEVLSFPKNDAELAQALSHNWFLPFDNVSYISHSTSDIICKAVTGSGFTKRELYTDDEDIIYAIKRIISLNGINLVATKPDLLERGILIQLERIPENERKQEKILLDEFERELPKILGGIFDIISKAMKIYPSIKLERLPRMADFAVWGCAISEALGYKKDNFLQAYYNNIKAQNEEVLMESLVATSIRLLTNETPQWEGNPSELLSKLKDIAANNNINTEEKGWPKSAASLSRKLNELKTNLANDGIKISTGNKNKERAIFITKEGV